VVVRPGDMVKFSCLAWSYGGLVYEWSKNNITLPSNASVSFENAAFSKDTSCITTMYHFEITNVQLTDEGMYCCIASNECGNTTKCAWLEVDSK